MAVLLTISQLVFIRLNDVGLDTSITTPDVVAESVERRFPMWKVKSLILTNLRCIDPMVQN